MLTLYQFPISHYCEKIRWALDYKNLEYRTINLLPGFHIRFIKNMASDSSVPVLVHDENVIQNSSTIITYLDENFPDKPLTPTHPEIRQQALAWESFVDEKIGDHVRRICYHTLLDFPDITLEFLTHGQPWFKKVMYRLLYSKVQRKMRKFMLINQRTTEISLKKLEKAVNKLSEHMQNHRFFAGDNFSRADLAAASLLAPFTRPDKYGLNWPQKYPEQLEQDVMRFNDKIAWVSDFYQQYR